MTNTSYFAKQAPHVREILIDSIFNMEVLDTFVSGTVIDEFYVTEKDTPPFVHYATLKFEEITVVTSKVDHPNGSGPLLISTMFVGEEEIAGYPIFAAYVPSVPRIIEPLFDMINHGSYQKDIEQAVNEQTWSKLLALAKTPEVSATMMALMIGLSKPRKDTKPNAQNESLISALTEGTAPVATFANMYNCEYMDRIIPILDKHFTVGLHPKFQPGQVATKVFKKHAAMVVIGIDTFRVSALYDKNSKRIKYSIMREDLQTASTDGNLTEEGNGKMLWATTYIYDLLMSFTHPPFLNTVCEFLSLTNEQKNMLKFIGESADVASVLISENLFNLPRNPSNKTNLLN